jgi:cell fate (sporulation/competence/biofilm development) regulator YlbF (YheA/YmcA/DUF963 family)
MDNFMFNEMEVASKPVVMHSARRFSEALAESAQFKAFEDGYQAFRQDDEVQSAYQALRSKQESLRMMMMLNAVSDEEHHELKALETEFYSEEIVQRYISAQEDLISLCQVVGDVLSDAIGLDFGSACRIGGCCG